MKKPVLVYLAFFLFSIMFLSCGGSGSSSGLSGNGNASLVAIEVTPANPSIAKSSIMQFTATAIYSDSTTTDVTDLITWSSSNTSVAVVSNSTSSAGLATARTAGTTVISASLLGVTGTANLTVTNATLASLSVLPALPAMAVGNDIQFEALGMYSDNTTQDITSGVTWSSSNTTVATISNAPGTMGHLSSLSSGTTVITASSGSIDGSTIATVGTFTIQYVTITPVTPTIAPGTTIALDAMAVYSDSSHHDITSQARWTSSNTGVATVNSSGLVTGISAGNTLITCSTSDGISSGQTTVTVSPVTLNRITLTPASPVVTEGYTIQLHATGTYSDGSTQDITASVTWSVDSNILTVSNANGSRGLASTVPGAWGQTYVTGTDPTSGINGRILVTVNAAVLKSIAVSAPSLTIPKGSTQQFTATGTFSDQTVANITSQVTWTSSNPEAASLSNSGTNGFLTALSAGPDTVFAIDPVSGVTGSANITITPAPLSRITITSPDTSIPAGNTEQFSATGSYADGTTANITSSVTWTVNASPQYASISNAPGTNGLLYTLTQTPVTVTATDPSTGVSASITFYIIAPTFSDFTVTPASSSIYNMSTAQFIATATYSNGTTADITSLATWTISDSSVGYVNASGLVFMTSIGNVVISANYNGKTHTVTLSDSQNTAHVVSVSAGGNFTVAVKDDGTVWEWGNDYSGQLGIGVWDNNNDTPYPTPWEVSGISGVTAVATGDMHVLAIKSDGTVWAWGNNYSGELGNGTYDYTDVPQQVPSLSNVIAVSASNMLSIALKSDGTVWTWGNNDHGQLGNGTTQSSSIPVQVQGLSGVIAIAAGNPNYEVALKSDGTVWAWGANGNGQLGNGSSAYSVAGTDSWVPVQVSGLTGIVKISTNDHTLALKNDGTLWGWGSNGCGQIGAPVTGWCGNFWYTVPAQIGGVSNIKTFAAGNGYSVVIENDGSVWTWGTNGSCGNMGDGFEDIETLDTHPNPGQVNSLSGITSVSASGSTIVMKSDGTLWSWGCNGSGQIGNGTSNPSYPYGVPSPVEVNPF